MCCHYTILHRRVLLYNALKEIANAFVKKNDFLQSSQKYKPFLFDKKNK